MPGPRVARGDRVTLRTFEREDVPFLQRAYAEPALRYPIGNPLLNEEQLAEWIDGDDGTDRFVACIDDEEAGPGHPEADETRRVGIVTVDDADWKRPEVAYWIVPEAHGEGFGSDAVSLALDHAFRTYDAPAVGACAYASNEASRGLLESLGFEREGRQRRHRFVDGDHVDLVRYGLLREEWRASE